MSLLRDLSDLMASAPDASVRDTLDAVSNAVDARDWYRAMDLIDAVPAGYTTWHERLEDARDRIRACESDESSGFVESDN